MKAYTVQVKPTEGKEFSADFDTFRHATRFFADHVGDQRILSVFLIDNTCALELAKWVNQDAPVMLVPGPTFYAVKFVNSEGNRVYARRMDDNRKAAVFTTREAAEHVASRLKCGEVVDMPTATEVVK